MSESIEQTLAADYGIVDRERKVLKLCLLRILSLSERGETGRVPMGLISLEVREALRDIGEPGYKAATPKDA